MSEGSEKSFGERTAFALRRERPWDGGDVAITDSGGKGSAMTNREVRLSRGRLKALLLSDEDGFRKALQVIVQETLEAEMTEAIGVSMPAQYSPEVPFESSPV
ncbi:hypothetical protein NKJ40_27655 [Mesorhizobium sp. M0119]|uniref:hypothetical protein n=1 Tax=Mesorhizobium sp. M0119 TaxID=2956885 RepID=UPI00333D4655